MENSILFSIITPAYNLENIIGATIESVLNQGYKNFEYIIINDGSIDNTLIKIENYAKLDSRIRVFSKENGGVSSARNLGIEKSKGEYLLFLDGDDIIESSLLEDSYKILKTNKVDMYSFGYVHLDSNGQKIKSYSKEEYNGKVFSGDKFLEKYLYKKIDQHICSAIVKRDIITENDFKFNIKTKVAEDTEFIIKIMSKSKTVYYNSYEYFKYYYRDGSAVNRKIKRENFDVYVRIDDYLKEINVKAARQNRCYWFVNFYRNILKKGSDSDTVRKFLEFETALKHYKFKFDRYGIVTLGFIILYRPFLKSYLINKYELE
jgi:glycosyltransferase involved in cell wall biosynthesis